MANVKLDTKVPFEVRFGNKDTHGLNLEILVDVGSITPKEIWENKNVWFEQAKNSRESWDGLMDEQREALNRMVRSALERMHDRVDEWVPEGLIVEGGKYMDVNIRILFTDIDKEIERNEAATSFQIEAAQADVAKWLDGQG